MRSIAEKMADTRRLIEAAQAIARDEKIFPELVASSGLSKEGTRKALDEHLEKIPSDTDLERFALKFADVSCVHVVLSSNVFVGALRAIACARAKGERVVVRPSSREPAFAKALVGVAKDPAIELIEHVDIRAIAEGEIHIYGRDETIAKVKKAARVKVVGHGAGMGVAWLTQNARIEDECDGIASDIIAFDQRGCLSLRVLYVEGGPSRAHEVAKYLHTTLNKSPIPRGILTREERAEAIRFGDAMTMAGETFEGRDHIVALIGEDTRTLPPPGRHVVVRATMNDQRLRESIAVFAPYICAFGTDDVTRARSLAPSHSRISALGKMQKPPLDGHVDLRVT